MIKVDLVSESKHPIPQYKTPGSAGMDLYANIEENFTLKAGERTLIPTGLKMQLPVGYEAQVRPRSGLALKHGITVLNSPGTIDSDYTGDVGVILINHSKEDYVIEPGERIAQMVFAKYEQLPFNPVLFLMETERGENGFGSTGKK